MLVFAIRIKREPLEDSSQKCTPLAGTAGFNGCSMILQTTIMLYMNRDAKNRIMLYMNRGTDPADITLSSVVHVAALISYNITGVPFDPVIRATGFSSLY